jgi:signal peptidase I
MSEKTGYRRMAVPLRAPRRGHRLDLRPFSLHSPRVTVSSTPAIDRAAKPASSGWGETAHFLITFLLLALLMRSTLFMARSIPSESMMPRLFVGDYVLVAKWPYGWSRFSLPWSPPAPHGRLLGTTPARGDVVVFRAPPDDHTDYIKRVIGLPGDRVQMRGGTLWLNGRAVPKVQIADFVTPMAANTECRSVAPWPYGVGKDAAGHAVCRFPRYRETLPDGISYDVIDQGGTPQDDTPEITVPAGRLFLLGDNRDMSEDSRFPAEAGAGVGLVPTENLEGRALVSFFSVDGSATLANPLSWFHAVRWARIGKGFW